MLSQASNLELGVEAFQAGDYAKAFQILSPIAREGYAEAQCIVGNIYELGLGIDPDFSEAIAWYRRAAEQGYIIAENNLGNLYLSQGDTKQAIEWLSKAAERGFPLARATLENMPMDIESVG